MIINGLTEIKKINAIADLINEYNSNNDTEIIITIKNKEDFSKINDVFYSAFKTNGDIKPDINEISDITINMSGVKFTYLLKEE